MGDSVENRPSGLSRIRRLVRLVLVGALIAGGTIVAQPLLSSSPSATAAAAVTFDVVSAFTSLDPAGPQAGDPITEWKYRIDRDNTGDPYDDPADCEFDEDLGQFPANFPTDCSWPSVHSFEPGNYTTGAGGESIASIVTHGDWTDFAPGGDFAGGITLENGKYLISVTAAGHKIGGAHFTVTDATVSPELITVALDPYPLPLVTLRARVFNDLSTNGQIDYPAEEVGPGESMAGFTATINDWADEVTTDWYGNPLCTEYVTDGNGRIVLDGGDPTPIEGTGGKCVSDDNGDIVIPNLGPNRYAMTIAPPPDDPNWVQTTTLEGGLDWDIWAMEGYTGYDTEFNVGGESVPWVNFGYVRPRSGTSASTPAYYSDGAAGTNTIKGVVARYDAYTPGVGQAPTTGTIWGGFSGAKVTGPIERPMVALLDLQDGDRAVWVGEGDAHGNFEINGVRDGEYQLTVWERDLLTLLDLFQVTVKDGQVLDTGVLGLTGWFANYYGHVFLDYNENGRMDPGEPGVPDYGLALLRRENAPVENGQNAATTGPDGYYEFEAAYPYTMWTVMEAYSDRYHTTGVTYQVSNQPEQTTLQGGGVDIHVLPIIGQSARIDWGVVPYQPGENGSIAGTVFYDTTINELDARVAAIEDWSTGVPGITLNAYDAVQQADGSWAKGDLVDTTTSETWERPGPCVPRDADGVPIPDQLLFPAGAAPCLEAPLTGIQVDPLAGDELGVAVNGNFGFGDLAPGKYIVEVDIPTDSRGRPLYRVENEESVNVFAGDVYTPQNTAGAPSAGPDVSDPGLFDGQMDTDGLPVSDPATQAPGAAAICVGEPRLVDITGEAGGADDDGYGYNETNPLFADAGGTPYQGAMMPGCEAKLIEVLDQRSVAPAFVLYNDVPPPAHFWGYSVDDLNIDTNPLRTTFGEKRGLSYSPTGVYNWAGRLITQVNADVNGIWEVLLPSSTTMNCPTPAGVCPGMYRFVGNDPGPVTAPFRDYNPNYRTIAANFQAWPGVNTVADTAPTQVGASILAPGGQFNALAVCAAEDTRPQVFTVNRPYARVTGTAMRDLVITGNRFLDPDDPGGPPGVLRLVDLDTDAVIATIPTDTWSDEVITATIDTPVDVRGAYQLEIVRSDGARPVNSVTYHVIGTGGGPGSVTYDPAVVEVGPGRQYETVQAGVDAYGDPYGNGRSDGVLVVVYPNTDIGTVPVVPDPLLDFSIAGNSTVPGVSDSGNWRDSDIYTWDGSAFSRHVDSTASGLNLPAGANVDGFSHVADEHFFMSFSGAVDPPGPLGVVQDEDVVEYDHGTWSLFFDGSANGIGGGGFFVPNLDLDAISVVDGTLFFSIESSLFGPPGAAGLGHPTNVYRWDGGSSYTRIVDAGSLGLTLLASDIDGMAYVDATHFHVSFSGTTLVPGIGLVDDEDVVQYDAGTWSLFFDGTAPGLTNGNHDIDAFDLRDAPLPPPPPGPQTPTRDGVYYENVIISTPVMVQGVGAGGVYEDGTAAVGTIVHGGDFWASAYDPTQPFAPTEPNAIAWYERLDQIDVFGDQPIADGSVFFVVPGNGPNTYRSDRVARLDGLKITGGDQRDFPGNVNQIGGGAVPGAGGAIGQAGNVTTQGGGVFLNGYANSFHITNNEFVSNGGAYGGAIRVGSPFAGDNNNDDVVIARNRIVSNGGTQLAGAIGIFNGADDYVIADNDICGNSSTEYGGGISHFGYSPNGTIHHNRVALNSSYDEGGGINIAGELPADPAALSPGAGPISVRNNMIASNLSNDDGGGLRFLQAGDFPFVVYNNIIANNVATHQGGGMALNDAPDVHILNNTIANNITTATAVTSDGLPAPAGLATTGHSAQLQATLPVGADDFSNPELVNNIFRDNRAGTWAGVAGITGIGKNGAADIEVWDIGANDGSAPSSISSSMLDDYHGADGVADGGNNIVATDPMFVLPEVTSVEVFTWRGFQRFRSAAIVSYDVTQSPIGDYHIDDVSPAVDAGTNTRVEFDIDDDVRPHGAGWDIGADERPVGTVPGPDYGPFTPVLDDFERTDPARVNNTNINYGLDPADWSGFTANGRVRIAGDPRTLILRNNGTQTWIGDEPFGDSQEAYVTVDRTSSTSSTVGVFVRATDLRPNGRFKPSSSYVEVAYAPYLGGVIVRTKRSDSAGADLRAVVPATFGSGDTLLARVNVNGDLEVHRRSGGTWELLDTLELGYGAMAWPTADTPHGGLIGINTTLAVRPGRLDDFGGGDVL